MPTVAPAAAPPRYVDTRGRPTSAGLPTYVWHRTDGARRIVAGQNTGTELPNG